jgi:hypothetical protein
MYNHEQALKRRDVKVRHDLNGVAPLWVVNDQWFPAEESFVFDLVYQHSIYGWIKQRFKYDAFNDVMYHMGLSQIGEDEALAIQETTPYIEGVAAIAVPNNPKPRGF